MMVLSPIVIVVVALIVDPEIPTLLPMIILLPDADMLKKQGWNIPTELDVSLLLQWKFFPIIISPFFISGCFNLSSQELRLTYTRPRMPQVLSNGSLLIKHQKKVVIVLQNRQYVLYIKMLIIIFY